MFSSDAPIQLSQSCWLLTCHSRPKHQCNIFVQINEYFNTNNLNFISSLVCGLGFAIIKKTYHFMTTLELYETLLIKIHNYRNRVRINQLYSQSLQKYICPQLLQKDCRSTQILARSIYCSTLVLLTWVGSDCCYIITT